MFNRGVTAEDVPQATAPAKAPSPVDRNTRLRVATRIHFALLRHLGDTVDVGDILHREAQTREVLWVCEGSGDEELMTLAKQFREALAAEQAAAVPPPAAQPPVARATQAPPPQDAAWSQDTSGFGVSRPPEIVEPASSGPAPRFRPMRWLRGQRP